MSNKFIIYTDGACIGNPGKGGWAAIILDDKNKKIVLSGAEKYTTNNKMELTATIKALKHLKDKSEIIIFTDSKYVIDGINNWIFKWKQNNWKTANKKEVKNKDLWLNLYKCINFHVVNWKWVKGHSGDTLNEEVDKLARGEAEKIIDS
ncbi:MAG: ribonuclease HI [Rickettsiales bacterium]|nr:ribonuclease HI [Rickettsiales bacterium]RPG13802.1 MAG: ribonuclease HI [Pelagibacteraceae bacterium TMED195]